MGRYLNPHGIAVLGQWRSPGEIGASPAQTALAWVAAQPGVTAPIDSATSVAQLEELLGSMDLELSEDQLARLDRASRSEPEADPHGRAR